MKILSVILFLITLPFAAHAYTVSDRSPARPVCQEGIKVVQALITEFGEFPVEELGDEVIVANQSTGSWTRISSPDNGKTICVISFGAGWKPGTNILGGDKEGDPA